MPMKFYDQFDIVKVPFPFSDKEKIKKRPAIIISSPQYLIATNHYILLMITSAKQSSWKNDIEISNLQKSGLPSPSKIRFKMFSLDYSIIISKIGCLDIQDTNIVKKNLKDILSF